jgi:endo-1,4-beta-mannosidase
VGATGALLWCFADYATELWSRPPCDQMKHERFFGLVRPDGSLKPHAEVVRRFAATAPTVLATPERRVELDITPDEFYRAPLKHTRRLYRKFTTRRQTA